MDRILVNFEPFTANQIIYVYQEGAVTRITAATVDNLTSVLKSLSTQYNISHIDLCGNNDYLSKFKTQINTEFSDNPIEVDIIKK